MQNLSKKRTNKKAIGFEARFVGLLFAQKAKRFS